MINISQMIYGRSHIHAINNNICVDCQKPATQFKDDISAKEYTITGLCQECQDSVFEGENDES